MLDIKLLSNFLISWDKCNQTRITMTIEIERLINSSLEIFFSFFNFSLHFYRKMSTSRTSFHHANSSVSVSSHATESPTLSNGNRNGSDTVLVAKKLSALSLTEREERQQMFDRLEIIKTVSSFFKFSSSLNNKI